MADSRTYIRVHDGMDEHPKIEGLTDAAFRLVHRCWYYCSRQLTDGRLTDVAWRNRGSVKARKELVDVGLVHLPGFDCPHEDCPPAPAGHVQMHDYLEHQRSAAEVEELRQKRSEAGRRGGRARAQAEASAKQVPEQTGSKAEAVSETEADTSLRSVGGARRPTARGTRIPEDFAVSEEMRVWARQQGWADRWIDQVTEQFRDYWKGRAGSNGTKTDWPATWRNWLRREAGERPAAAGGSTSGGGLRPWEL